ncbi:MAG: hypothetical protein MHM6MM_005577 [Cercozoa sp. M6MM]
MSNREAPRSVRQLFQIIDEAGVGFVSRHNLSSFVENLLSFSAAHSFEQIQMMPSVEDVVDELLDMLTPHIGIEGRKTCAFVQLQRLMKMERRSLWFGLLFDANTFWAFERRANDAQLRELNL